MARKSSVPSRRLKIAHHLYRSPKEGKWSYRYVVPKRYREAMGIGEIRQALGTTDLAKAQVMAAKLHSETMAKLKVIDDSLPTPTDVTELDLFIKAIDKLKAMGYDLAFKGNRETNPDEYDHRLVLADQILEKHLDTSNLEEQTFPTITPDESAFVAALQGNLKEPDYSWKDATRVYLQAQDPLKSDGTPRKRGVPQSRVQTHNQ